VNSRAVIMKALLSLVLAACASEPAFDPARCEVRTYRIHAVDLPQNSKQARMFGVDLDGDKFPDNQLGQISGTLTHNFDSLDLEANAATHLATDTDWQIAFASDCVGGFERAAVTAGGDEPVFDLEVERVDGALTARGPTAVLPITALFDGTGTAETIFITALRAQLDVLSSTLDEDELTARIGTAANAVEQGILVVRAMTPFLAQDAEGIELFDANDDGKLTEAEIANNGLAVSLLAPDLEIEDVGALGFGLRVHATRLRD
jgi:hypothetical protein